MFARAVLIIPGALSSSFTAPCAGTTRSYLPSTQGCGSRIKMAWQSLQPCTAGCSCAWVPSSFLSGILQGYLRPGLWLLMMVLGGLAAARGSVAFGNFDLTVQAAQGAADVAMSSEFTGYTWYALLV